MLTFNSLDVVDTLKMAIQCKIDLESYYNNVASLIQNDDAVAILRGLAEKEEKQRVRLIKFYSRLSGKKILYLNLGKRHKLNTLVKCGIDPVEAVRQAKKNETEVKNYFLSVSRRFLENDLRSLFQELAKEEEQHLALLESSFVEPISFEPNSIKSDALYTEVVKGAKESVKTW
jgi:rubrerythrin